MILAIINQSIIFIGLLLVYSNTPKDRLWNAVIDGRFRVQYRIGKGYTGSVYSGIDLETDKKVAIKFANEETFYSIETEYENYKQLGALDPNIVERGIPHIMHYGDFGQYKVLVMTKTGQDLDDLKDESPDEKFTFSTICKIGIQGIRIFEYIHSRGLLFHDVKPHNIAVGRSNENQIFFFDFAFSEFHIDEMGVSKPRTFATDCYGSPEYMAKEPLNRMSHVRKDDLISFGIVLLELNGVVFPWANVTRASDDIYTTMDIVLRYQEQNSIETYFNKSDNPQFFTEYFNYFDSVESHERPDYDYLVDLFKSQLTPEELADDDLGIFARDDAEDDNTKYTENTENTESTESTQHEAEEVNT